jgi:tetratricopeptide (TPR) repeat protein
MGDVALARGDATTAWTQYQAAFECFHQLNDSSGMAWARRNLGRVAYRRGEAEHAASLLLEGLRTFAAQGDTYGSVCCIAGVAGVLKSQGALERAARLFGVVDGECTRLQRQYPAGAMTEFVADMRAVRERLQAAQWESAWASGQTTTLEQAIAEVIGLSGTSR